MIYLKSWFFKGLLYTSLTPNFFASSIILRVVKEVKKIIFVRSFSASDLACYSCSLRIFFDASFPFITGIWISIIMTRGSLYLHLHFRNSHILNIFTAISPLIAVYVINPWSFFIIEVIANRFNWLSSTTKIKGLH